VNVKKERDRELPAAARYGKKSALLMMNQLSALDHCDVSSYDSSEIQDWVEGVRGTETSE